MEAVLGWYLAVDKFSIRFRQDPYDLGMGLTLDLLNQIKQDPSLFEGPTGFLLIDKQDKQEQCATMSQMFSVLEQLNMHSIYKWLPQGKN